MRQKLLAGISSVLLLAGCAIQDGRPEVGRFDTPSQLKLKSAQHWGIVADDIALHIQESIAHGDQPLYVPTPRPNTSFGRVLSSQLRSSLAQRGFAVSTSEPGALRINLAVDEVRHVATRSYRPGTLTALAAGVMVVRDAALGRHDPASTVVAVAASADIAAAGSAKEKRPDTEAVLTISIEKDGKFLMHRTDVYYVDDADAGLFVSSGREFQVTGGGGK